MTVEHSLRSFNPQTTLARDSTYPERTLSRVAEEDRRSARLRCKVLAMKILIVDNDKDLVDLLRYAFQRDGYKVVIAFDGEAALHVFKAEAPTLIILDLLMPKRHGLEVLKAIRETARVPVILLTAVGDEENVVEGFRLGADDYVIKPFRPRELKMRVSALLRRSQVWSAAQQKPHELLIHGDLYLDPQRREVTIADRLVHLTRTEFDLLEYLMLNHDVVIRVTDLVANIWGYDSDIDEDIVKVTISRMRHKIEPNHQQPRYIITVYGVGYMFQSKSL